MFGNNNNYLFPPPSLRYHHHPEIFSGLVDHHHHHAYAAGNNQDDVDVGDPSAMERMFHGQKKPTPVKKDRHSKIFTSQGPRDRRVRLSIGIARKFFDLQEMLGFDKPSKTLDWLFTKSKAAIKDLVQTKEKTSKHDDDDSKGTSSSPLPSDSELGGNEKGKSGNMKNKGSSSSLAKESRAKARARARERTREKMSIKQQVKNGGEANSEDNYVNPVGVFQLSEHHQRELAQDSVMIKRKMKIPFFGLQQNAFFPGYGAGSFESDDQNRDACEYPSQANLCAVLDQHRFM